MKSPLPIAPIVCALVGVALFALALHFGARAARERSLADRIRGEVEELAPDLESAECTEEELRRLETQPAPDSDPATILSEVGIAASKPETIERPVVGNTLLRVRETTLSCPSVDPSKLSQAVAATGQRGHRLVGATIDPVPGLRVRARLRFLTFIPAPPPVPVL